MDYITTTQLRTQTPKLVKLLMAGKSIPLLHRSKHIATFEPHTPTTHTRPKDRSEFNSFVESIKPKKTISPKQAHKNYQKHLEEKYVKTVS